jgi:hypothetical protein
LNRAPPVFGKLVFIGWSQPQPMKQVRPMSWTPEMSKLASD